MTRALNRYEFAVHLDSLVTWFGGCGPLDDVGRAAITEHVEECRASVRLAATSPQWTELMGWLGEFVVEHYLSPEARRQGYGMEDVIGFVDFLQQELSIA